MSFQKGTRESSAQAAVRSMSPDEAVTYAISDGAVNAQGERIPVKQVADLMNMPLSVVYDIASGRRPARARELPLIVIATNCTLPVDCVEHRIGRVGVRLPEGAAAHDLTVGKASRMVREFGELMERYGAAGEDRQYTRSEVRSITVEAEELCASVMEFVSQLQAQAVPDVPLKAVR